ncbi:HipA N-terminal domain-containing protein [Jannaschia pohangensis]|uniref:HipA N-terminal domain-containing protein n=1 Tax=Jannaschia pohangensis TaxID=390807 RepID=UPI0011136141
MFYESREVAESASGRGDAGTLTYSTDWQGTRCAFPVSTRMPLEIATQGAGEVLPWVASLLPENHS